MKKLFLVLGLGLVFVACGDGDKAKEEVTVEKQPSIEVIETPVVVVEPQNEADTNANVEENKSESDEANADTNTEDNKSESDEAK